MLKLGLIRDWCGASKCVHCSILGLLGDVWVWSDDTDGWRAMYAFTRRQICPSIWLRPSAIQYRTLWAKSTDPYAPYRNCYFRTLVRWTKTLQHGAKVRKRDYVVQYWRRTERRRLHVCLQYSRLLPATTFGFIVLVALIIDQSGKCVYKQSKTPLNSESNMTSPVTSILIEWMSGGVLLSLWSCAPAAQFLLLPWNSFWNHLTAMESDKEGHFAFLLLSRPQL